MFTAWIIAFLIFVAWILIFYPLVRKFREGYPILLTVATILTIITLAAKEWFQAKSLIYNEVIFFAAGVLFGIALLALIFILKNNWLKSLPQSAFIGDRQSQSTIPLRHVLQIGIFIEENGNKFYKEMSQWANSEDTKKLYDKLADDELKHKEKFEHILYQWLPLPIDKMTLDTIKEELKQRGLFEEPPSPQATEEEVIKYAIRQEEKTIDFYRSFEKSYPEAWKRLKIQGLIKEEIDHADKLGVMIAHAS